MEVYSKNNPPLTFTASIHKPVLSDFHAVTHTQRAANTPPEGNLQAVCQNAEDDTKEVRLATWALTGSQTLTSTVSSSEVDSTSQVALNTHTHTHTVVT